MKILKEIESYQAGEAEVAFIRPFIDLLSSERSFYRDYFTPGHITGSALLLNKSGTKVLMNHHKSLDKWLCFGGHADGEQNILNVTRREIVEESGIEIVEPIFNQIFDLDIHPIPANDRKGEPLHSHYDIRYVFKAQDENFKISDESLNLKWCNFEEAEQLAGSSGMKRLLAKAKKL